MVIVLVHFRPFQIMEQMEEYHLPEYSKLIQHLGVNLKRHACLQMDACAQRHTACRPCLLLQLGALVQSTTCIRYIISLILSL